MPYSRDPARVWELVTALGRYMDKYPDMRLGQIVGNAAASTSLSMEPDPYLMEDDKLLAYLQSELRLAGRQMNDSSEDRPAP